MYVLKIDLNCFGDFFYLSDPYENPEDDHGHGGKAEKVLHFGQTVAEFVPDVGAISRGTFCILHL